MTADERDQIARWGESLRDTTDPAAIAACARMGRLLAGDAG
jgi:hypothetical protein